MRGLYVHIPFCVRKCSYCDFYSLPARQDKIESYVQAILKEAKKYSPVSPLALEVFRPKSFCLKQNVPERDGVRGDSTLRHSESFHRRTNNLVSPTTSSDKLLYHEMGESRVRGDSPQCYAEVPQNPSFQTLYIGGGTPSLLGSKNLTTLITGLPCHSERSEESSSSHHHCERSAAISGSTGGLLRSPVGSGFEPDRPAKRVDSSIGLIESTIELNPESTTPEFLRTVKNLGFNRVSFGVQSLNDNELKSVGRIHTAVQAINAIKLAQKLDFKAISADLIIGLPGQTWTSLRKSLETLVGMGIQHLSVYCLSLEADTPLGNNPPPDLPNDDLQAALFEKTRNYLKTCGFAHYEISNFALPGYECLHNLNYWRGGEYLGLGPAAASHLNGKRFKNRANLDAYLQNPTGQIEDVEELRAKDKAAEEAMLRLRLLEEGMDSQVLISRFGQENAQDIFTRLDKMVQEGLLIHEGLKYRLTPSRIMTSNPIFMRVLGS